MLGEEWQKLSETEKEAYGTMAENDKKRYQSEMEAYDSTNTNGNVGPMNASLVSHGGLGSQGGGGTPGGVADHLSWRM